MLPNLWQSWWVGRSNPLLPIFFVSYRFPFLSRIVLANGVGICTQRTQHNYPVCWWSACFFSRSISITCFTHMVFSVSSPPNASLCVSEYTFRLHLYSCCCSYLQTTLFKMVPFKFVSLSLSLSLSLSVSFSRSLSLIHSLFLSRNGTCFPCFFIFLGVVIFTQPDISYYFPQYHRRTTTSTSTRASCARSACASSRSL